MHLKSKSICQLAVFADCITCFAGFLGLGYVLPAIQSQVGGVQMFRSQMLEFSFASFLSKCLTFILETYNLIATTLFLFSGRFPVVGVVY